MARESSAFDQMTSLNGNAILLLGSFAPQVSDAILSLSNANPEQNWAGMIFGAMNLLADLATEGSGVIGPKITPEAEAANLAQQLSAELETNRALRLENAKLVEEKEALLEKGRLLSQYYLRVVEEINALEHTHFTSARETNEEAPAGADEVDLRDITSPQRRLSDDVRKALFITLDDENDPKKGSKKPSKEQPAKKPSKKTGMKGKAEKKEEDIDTVDPAKVAEEDSDTMNPVEGEERGRTRHQQKSEQPLEMKGKKIRKFVKTWVSRHKGDKNIAIGNIEEHRFVYPNDEDIPLGVDGRPLRLIKYREDGYEVETVTKLVIVHHMTGIYADDAADKLNRAAKKEAQADVTQGQTEAKADAEANVEEDNSSRSGKGTIMKVFYEVAAKVKLFSNSYLSPILLAQFLYFCYVLSLPAFRIQSWLNGMGMFPCYGTLIYWKSLAARKLKPLADFLHQELLAQSNLQGDESPGLINGEEGAPKKSYWWFYTTIAEAVRQICVVIPHLGRSGFFAKQDLKGFHGTLASDAYSGYNAVEGIIRALCNNHARRKFFYAFMFSFTKHQRALAKKIMDLFDQCQKLETEISKEIAGQHEGDPGWYWTDADFEERKEKRKGRIAPIYGKIKKACLEIKKDPLVYDNCLLMRAVNYVLNNEEGLSRFLEDGSVPFHNMRVEQIIKKFATRRRSTLFNGSLEGAKCDGINMTVIYTLEMNGLDVQKYLCAYFEAMRGKDTEKQIEVVRSFAPWLPEIQEKYRATENIRKKGSEFQPAGSRASMCG